MIHSNSTNIYIGEVVSTSSRSGSHYTNSRKLIVRCHVLHDSQSKVFNSNLPESKMGYCLVKASIDYYQRTDTHLLSVGSKVLVVAVNGNPNNLVVVDYLQ